MFFMYENTLFGDSVKSFNRLKYSYFDKFVDSIIIYIYFIKKCHFLH